MKISINFSKQKYSDTELCVKGNKIVDSLRNNEAFPDPDPTIDDLSAAIDLFYHAIDDVADGSHHDTLVKNQLRADVEKS